MEGVAVDNLSSSKPWRQGYVQVLTGEGKGKTTAALGTVLRALGHGLRICIVVFMKGYYPHGEWDTLSQMPNVRVVILGSRDFIDPANIKPEEIEQAKQSLAAAREAILSGSYDLIVLDEVNMAVAWQLIKLDEVVELIEARPPNVELILTGRNAHARLIELADLVTECVKIKHPYDKGITAREGIEY